MGTIFIRHVEHAADRMAAAQIAEALEGRTLGSGRRERKLQARTFPFWAEETDPPDPEHLKLDQIAVELRGAAAVVLVLSERSRELPRMRAEAEAGLRLGLDAYVLIHGMDRGRLPEWLTEWDNAADYIHCFEDPERLAEALREGLRRVLVPAPKREPDFDVFFCYPPANYESGIAAWLARKIEKRKIGANALGLWKRPIRCFHELNAIPPGVDSVEYIFKAIENSSIFVFVVTETHRNWRRYPFLRKELSRMKALARGQAYSVTAVYPERSESVELDPFLALGMGLLHMDVVEIPTGRPGEMVAEYMADDIKRSLSRGGRVAR